MREGKLEHFVLGPTPWEVLVTNIIFITNDITELLSIV